MTPSNAPLPEIDEIIRSKRTSFSLEIKPDGRLIVRVPEAATDKQVNAIVAQKNHLDSSNTGQGRQAFSGRQSENVHYPGKCSGTSASNIPSI